MERALVSGAKSPLNSLSGAVGASPKGACGELLNLDSMSWPGEPGFREHSLTLKTKDLTRPKRYCLS